MKLKIICIILFLISFLFVSCTNISGRNAKSDEAQDNPAELSSGEEHTTNEAIWNKIESQSADMNNDGKKEDISLYDSQEKYKIRINDSEYYIEPDFSGIMYVSDIKIIKFITLENGYQGLLLGLISEGGFDDYSFMVIGYDDGEISVLLDGLNMPFNNINNYRVKYLGDYRILFEDSFTGFATEYTASSYKLVEDGQKHLELVNDRETSSISTNYFNVEVQDINSDGIDEIIASKYLPGVYHADLLGIIDYKFSYQKGCFKLYQESFSYDGEEIKKMELQQ